MSPVHPLQPVLDQLLASSPAQYTQAVSQLPTAAPFEDRGPLGELFACLNPSILSYMMSA